MVGMDRTQEQPSPLVTRKLKLSGLSRSGMVADVRRHRTGPLAYLAGRNTAAVLLLSGWAAELVVLEDGRRQIIDLLLPGQLVSPQVVRGEVAAFTPCATAAVRIADATEEDAERALLHLVAAERSAREARLFAAVVSLGRRSAYERLAHLLLNVHLRLFELGLAQRDSFDLPLTQELLSDVVGLSVVHVNRTLQLLRSERHLSWQNGRVVFMDRAALAATVGYAYGKSPVPTGGAADSLRRSA